MSLRCDFVQAGVEGRSFVRSYTYDTLTSARGKETSYRSPHIAFVRKDLQVRLNLKISLLVGCIAGNNRDSGGMGKLIDGALNIKSNGTV